MARLPLLLALALAGLTAGGMVVLWPGDTDPRLGQGLVGPTERAQVERVVQFRCPGPAELRCRRVRLELETGSEAGRDVAVQIGGGALDPDFQVGNRVRVAKSRGPPGTPATYNITDFERRTPMLVLALLFCALVVALGRLRGALSLVGLGLSLAVVLTFVVPAILDGKPPLAVAVVGSFAVMLTTVALAHGVGPKSLAAMLGTAVSLLLTVALAVLFTDLTHLTGLASEEATILQGGDEPLELRGLVLAGMVIGALGVLDDVTISQSSTVLALRAANPRLGGRALFGRALQVGRDHVTATVNTLVLAYVGAALPLLLVFSSANAGLADTLSIELIAKEVVATLVGSCGLIAAVPITTAIAALLARGSPSGQPATR